MTHDPPVVIMGTHYVVVMDGRTHVVTKDRTCICEARESCPAVYVVARYLYAGGRRAPDVVPTRRPSPAPLPPCPICGAAVQVDHALDREGRGPGWRCTVGGYAHLFLYRYPNVQKWFCEEGAKRHEVFI